MSWPWAARRAVADDGASQAKVPVASDALPAPFDEAAGSGTVSPERYDPTGTVPAGPLSGPPEAAAAAAGELKSVRPEPRTKSAGDGSSGRAGRRASEGSAPPLKKRRLPTEGFTDEELRLWIAERRQNYPTKSNVEAKLAREEKKRAAGALGPARGTRRAPPNRSSAARNPRSQTPVPSTPATPSSEPVPGGAAVPALSALAAYGSDSDPDSTSHGEPPTALRESEADRAQDSSPPNAGAPKPHGREHAKNSSRKRPQRQPQQPPVRRKDNLLRKLLEPAIHREQNALLQCIRYVVNNDFFGAGADKPPARLNNST